SRWCCLSSRLSGPALMNCGRAPTTDRNFTRLLASRSADSARSEGQDVRKNSPQMMRGVRVGSDGYVQTTMPSQHDRSVQGDVGLYGAQADRTHAVPAPPRQYSVKHLLRLGSATWSAELSKARRGPGDVNGSSKAFTVPRRPWRYSTARSRPSSRSGSTSAPP